MIRGANRDLLGRGLSRMGRGKTRQALGRAPGGHLSGCSLLPNKVAAARMRRVVR
jgi:hypothetical protein